MTRKDFKLIAESLLIARPDNQWRGPGVPEPKVGDAMWEAWRATVLQMAASLRSVAPAFDKGRFLEAAGYPS